MNRRSKAHFLPTGIALALGLVAVLGVGFWPAASLAPTPISLPHGPVAPPPPAFLPPPLVSTLSSASSAASAPGAPSTTDCGVSLCVEDNISVGSGPSAVLFDPTSDLVYVADGTSDNLTVINGESDNVVGSIPTGDTPNAEAFDPENGNIYVTNYKSDNLTVVNGTTEKVVGSIAVGSEPDGVAFDPSNGDLYVADESSNILTVVNGSSDRATGYIPVGEEPMGVAFDPTNGDLYVANVEDGTVSVVNGSNSIVLRTIGVGATPWSVAVDAATDDIYVSNFLASSNVTVIDQATDRTVANIPVGSQPAGVIFDPANLDLYVADAGANEVTQIAGSGEMVAGSVVVGSEPDALGFRGPGQIYVANYEENSISVLFPGEGATRPTASVAASASEGSAPLRVGFLAYPWGGSGVYTGWAWHFGDGQQSDLQDPVHTYTAEGDYTAWVNVTDTLANKFQSNELTIVVGSALPTPVSVAISPSTASVVVDSGVLELEASTTCSQTCPSSGISYAWSINTLSLGTLSSTTYYLADFEPGDTPGTVSVFVNATLNGVTQESSPAVITITQAVLTSAKIFSFTNSESSVSVDTGGTVDMLISVLCTGPCPTGWGASWSVTNSLGTLEPWTYDGPIPSEAFVAGSSTGTDVVFANVTLNGVTVRSAPMYITIVSPSPSSSGEVLGLPALDAYALFGAIAVVVAAIVVLLLFRRRGRASGGAVRAAEVPSSPNRPPEIPPPANACPHCGAPVHPEWAFCPKCTSAIPKP